MYQTVKPVWYIFFAGFWSEFTEHIFYAIFAIKGWSKLRRWIMHVDMDAFFAAVEQRDHVEYRGKPVIVGGLSSRGVVATASYEARQFGVFSAMPMAKARQRCPQGIFVSGNHRLYEMVSAEIFQIFHEFSPLVEPLSIDEAFLDVSGMEKITADLAEYARELKAQIKSEVGLVASVGIAPNKFLAKLASDLQKPDGLVVIGYGEEKAALAHLPIRRIWGIGGKSAEKLNALGFKTVGDIAKADIKLLVKYFGKAAYQFVALANGQDERTVESDRIVKSIGNEVTFDEDLTRLEAVEKNLLALAEKVAWRLRLSNFTAKTITIKIRLSSFQTITRSQTLVEPTNFDEEIYQVALALYRQANSRGGIRLLGISGSNLSENEQASLFQEDGRKKALYMAVDELKERFGEKIITKAHLLKEK